MVGQTPSQNSERNLRIDSEVIEPYLRRLDDLLKETALKIKDKNEILNGGSERLDYLFVAANVNDFKGFGTVEGDASLRSNDKEPPIVDCYLRNDPLGKKISCYNMKTNRSFRIPNSSYLQDIEETVRGLLSTIYWEIHKDYKKELLEKGVPLNVIIENDEPIKVSKLYAYIKDINSRQNSYDNPKIKTSLSQEDRGAIIYNGKGSEILILFKYCDF
jgi:hypothetical protein